MNGSIAPEGLRMTALAALVLVGTVTVPRHAADAQANAPVGESADHTAVRSFWSTLDSTWNARDGARFGQLFTEDASFRFVDRGQSLESRAAIHRHFTEQFSRQAPELRHVTQVRDTRLVAPNVVAVDGHIEVLRTGSDEGAAPTVLRTFASVAVMLRSADGWKIQLLRVYQMPATPAAQDTEVFVLGALGALHEREESFGFATLDRIIRRIDPDVVLLEVTPEELAGRLATRGRPEYPKVAWPRQAKEGGCGDDGDADPFRRVLACAGHGIRSRPGGGSRWVAGNGVWCPPDGVTPDGIVRVRCISARGTQNLASQA